MFDGVLYQLGSAVQAERLHYGVPVKFERSRRNMQDFRNFPWYSVLRRLIAALRVAGAIAWAIVGNAGPVPIGLPT